MRKPARNQKKAEDFINEATDTDRPETKHPWEKGLSKKYAKDTGKIINIRLPEYYAECLQYLAEQDSRSQHSELVHLVKLAIDQAIISIKKELK